MSAAITILLDASNYVLILMLVALGLAIVFGLMNVINMAHGEFMMLGAYVVLACHQAGLPMRPGLLAESDRATVSAVLEELAPRPDGEVMPRPAVTIAQDSLVTEAIDLMLSKKVTRLPVVDAAVEGEVDGEGQQSHGDLYATAQATSAIGRDAASPRHA